MAKEVAISKRVKITKAQQNTLSSVLIASVIFGAALSITINLFKRITFNAEVIMAKDQAIVSYSKVIKNVGICKAPSGEVYSEDELNRCNPDSVGLSEVPGTLRTNILNSLAADVSLNSVVKEDENSCINPETGHNFTYAELEQNYKSANNAETLARASSLIKTCSALRVIPDALPAFRNEEALLSSLNKIFNISGWQPESLMPDTANPVSHKEGLYPIGVNLSVETDIETSMKLLSNIERSIREFNITNASIQWVDSGLLSLSARAEAYYVKPAKLNEVDKTITAGDEQ